MVPHEWQICSCLTSSQLWRGCRFRYFLIHKLGLSTETNEWVFINTLPPGKLDLLGAVTHMQIVPISHY